jgi:hypothetical protein
MVDDHSQLRRLCSGPFDIVVIEDPFLIVACLRNFHADRHDRTSRHFISLVPYDTMAFWVWLLNSEDLYSNCMRVFARQSNAQHECLRLYPGTIGKG